MNHLDVQGVEARMVADGLPGRLVLEVTIRGRRLQMNPDGEVVLRFHERYRAAEFQRLLAALKPRVGLAAGDRDPIIE